EAIIAGVRHLLVVEVARGAASPDVRDPVRRREHELRAVGGGAGEVDREARGGIASAVGADTHAQAALRAVHALALRERQRELELGRDRKQLPAGAPARAPSPAPLRRAVT